MQSDPELSQMEAQSLLTQNQALLKQNKLLKEEISQLKTMQSQTQKETSLYKNIVLKNSNDSEVLEMQHQRIFELETQLQILQGKYDKMVKQGGSREVTEYELKCRDYERKIKEN